MSNKFPKDRDGCFKILLTFFVIFSVVLYSSFAAKPTASTANHPGGTTAGKLPESATISGGGGGKTRHAEPVIEDVTAKQLEKVLSDKDYVAVFWYTRSCHTCDKVLEELEKIDDDTDSFGVDFVKINDKRLAKHYGIKNFPALTYFRGKEPIIYEGDLMDEDNVLNFLTSLEALDLPDRIEEVNAKILQKIIEDTDYVAVLFYKQNCKKCAKALQELENIDDEADQLGIGFVKIADSELADEYNLGELPKLVYYRHQIPIVYENELTKEEDVLEWLVQNKSTGDEDDVIEDVTAKTLETLISSVDYLVVLFYDNDDQDSLNVLAELEKIDDDCDKHGIQFVKIDDTAAAKSFGIDSIPSIVYFEKKIPNLYDGDLENEEEILEWLLSQLEEDRIEDVTDEMLDRLISDGKTLAVLFYDNNDRKSQRVLNELENIDDECDKLGISFVKIDNEEEAKEYGIEKLPALVYFEKGIPLMYKGNLEEEEKVLAWLEYQLQSDEIEDVTDEMLDMLIQRLPYVAVLFYDKNQKKSQKTLVELENIDDECDQNGIAFVKIDDQQEAQEYGVVNLPQLIFFEKKIPHVYEGDLMKEEELLSWLIHQKRHSEIPEVTNKILDKLIDAIQYLAVLFYNKNDKQDIRILNELENIDDDLEKEGIVIVRIDDKAEAKEYGISHLPTLIYFENKIPALYEGELINEEEVLKWLLEQKATATIEEVTDEILKNLIDEHEYVLVYFSGSCEEGAKCDKILDGFENIDDELDESGIVFVTTEDQTVAKEYAIKNYPALVFFRNKDPLHYTGDLEDEDEVLAWLNEDSTLEIPGKIEEVNTKMLDKILSENEHVVVFFYKEGDKKSQKILAELENIDDECEEKDISFVKTSDEGVDKEYELPSLPAVVYYRNKFRKIYSGDLMHEEAILEWVLQLHLSTPDVIESVDRKTLRDLISSVEHLAVFFYSDKCEECESILNDLETIDDDTDRHGIQFVKSKDSKLASEIGIFSFPALVYYETGVPIMYDGNLKNENKVLEWIINQKSKTRGKKKNPPIEPAEKYNIQKRINAGDSCFYIGLSGKEHGSSAPTFDSYQCCRSDIKKHHQTNSPPTTTTTSTDNESSSLSSSKKISSKKNGKENPTTATAAGTSSSSSTAVNSGGRGKRIQNEGNDSTKGNLLDEGDILQWMMKQKLDQSIEDIDRNTLFSYIEKKEFLAVVWYTEQNNNMARILRHVELIDDEALEYGITVVKCNDRLMAKKYGFRNPPGVTYFRRGKYINYDGDIEDDEELLDWLTDPGNMEMTDHIEPVNRKMFEKIRQTSDYIAVFFYSDDCKQCNRVLTELEHIDDEADNLGIDFVKINDKKFSKEIGVFALPAVVFFKIGSDEPVIFAGDLYKEEDILSWLMTQKDPSGDVIEELEGEDLLYAIRTSESLAVFFWNKTQCDICEEHNRKHHKKDKNKQHNEQDAPIVENDEMNDCEQCAYILEELENIDDDCDRHGITFVKTKDYTLAETFGIIDLPSLVYFEKQIPNVFEGHLEEEEEVLQWLITQRTEDRIELITRSMLELMVEDTQYLAVYFYKLGCNICDQILEGLEKIDDECDVFGIHLVKIQDPQLAKRYSIKTFPALVYFRNGNPLLFEGDLQNEDSVLEWLIDDDNRELADEIEEVNSRMLERLLDESLFLAVFFYDDNCEDCNEILEELEIIDGEADLFGIDMVKISDLDTATKYNIINLPTLVYFRKRVPLIYDGDLYDEDKVLTWLTSQDVFEIKNEIEEVNRKMLDKLLDENEFLAVYFYEKNSPQSMKVLDKLERIDGETDNMDIIFVKMADPRYARKWGVMKLPAVVYFRNRFPSIYRGEFDSEDDVLEWLRKNRYRQPELNIFMYALIALTMAFVIYTVFLLYGFQQQQQQPQQSQQLQQHFKQM